MTTFFIGLAPVNQITHTRLSLELCIFYAMFLSGALVDITGEFAQNPDEKQAVVIFDVTNLQYVTARQCDRGYVSHISLCLIAVTLAESITLI